MTKIATDVLGTPYVTLDTNSLFSVQAMFQRSAEAQLAGLNAGQRITVDCRCDGKLMDVYLSDCKLDE